MAVAPTNVAENHTQATSPRAIMTHPNAADDALMEEALALAKRAIGLSDPNPRVGCVIVSGGQLIGRGHTQAMGGPHAEAMALQEAVQRGANVRGATAYVTLEPCSHHGQTPPCCDALIAAGLARVVVAVQDPNPLVVGQGIARLRAAGIVVDLGLMADEAREINIGFFSRMLCGRPWVRVKAAVSVDGRSALSNGASQWITGEAARADGHAWRKRAGALLTGVGTVLADNPRLDVRLVATQRQPLRVIVDSGLATPLDARVLEAPGDALIYAAAPGASTVSALRARGIELVLMPDSTGKVDLKAVLHDLAARGVNELHVEAGPRLNGALASAALVDEWLVYMAPRLLGIGKDLANFGPLEELPQTLALRFRSVEQIGGDLCLLLRPDVAVG